MQSVMYMLYFFLLLKQGFIVFMREYHKKNHKLTKKNP